MQLKLRNIIDSNDTLSGKIFDMLIQSIILMSVISFSLETLPDITDEMMLYLNGFETFCVTIFTFEYFARIYCAEDRKKFIFSFFGIIDLLAILPFYLVVGLDLRTVRSFRFLRLVRIFKLARYSGAVQRFHKVFIIVKEELILFFFVALITIYLAAVGIYYFEHPVQPDVFQSIFHSLWWAVATLTTVGYGDVYPITVGGKIFTFAVLIVGLGIVSIPAGLVASALSKAREMDE